MIEWSKADERDAAALAALEKQSFSHPWSQEAFLTLLGDPNSLCLVAKKNERLLAYVTVSFVWDRGQINTVAVDPEFRGQGLAKTLLQQLIAHARQRGILALELEVRESNRAALGLYRGLGFATVGRRKKYYRDPTEDALLMDLEL